MYTGGETVEVGLGLGAGTLTRMFCLSFLS